VTERICIRRLRKLAASPKLTESERDDLVRAIQALQYTHVTGREDPSVTEIFELDVTRCVPVAASLEEARVLLEDARVLGPRDVAAIREILLSLPEVERAEVSAVPADECVEPGLWVRVRVKIARDGCFERVDVVARRACEDRGARLAEFDTRGVS